MDRLTIENIPQMFDYVGILFAEKRDELCAMDAVMGDGDLGLTMSKGYGALPAFLRDLTGEGDIGKMMLKGAMKMQNTVPSTMGTLMSSGIMEAGKAFRGKTELVPADMVTYVNPVCHRHQEAWQMRAWRPHHPRFRRCGGEAGSCLG